jgi:TM2 domain-containing membrane protein YozV
MIKSTLFILLFILIIALSAQDKPMVNFTAGYALNTVPITNISAIHVSPEEQVFPAFEMKPELIGQKSPGLAVLMSLVLPGSGEFYMGRRGQATAFFSSEIVLWTGLLFNTLYADHLKDEYRTYAVQYAGVQLQGKDKQYWIDIGKYNSLYDFNEQRRRDRFFSALYPEDGNYFWLWDEENNRLRYDGKRIRAQEISNQDVYFYASILLNHLVSGINALRLARKHNRQLIENQSWGLRFDATPAHASDRYFGVRVSAQF